MVARGLSAERAPLPLVSPSEELHAGAQMLGVCVSNTHMHADTCRVRRCCNLDAPHSRSTVFVLGCVCVPVPAHVCVCMVFKSKAFALSRLLACVHSRRLFLCYRSALMSEK